MASLDECVPDLVCLGKALGAGVPISACVGRREAFEAWGKHGGTAIHTATHFGAPPACAAALATLTELRERDLPARATELGRRFREELTGSGFLVSGRGAMVGISLDSSGHALAVGRRLLREGYLVLTGGVRGDKLTLSPPLVLDFKHVQGFSDALRRASSKAS
jgi:4-aminobutyrate aminotransferase/(S)-3-amino-2-methylpropionate transaminase